MVLSSPSDGTTFKVLLRMCPDLMAVALRRNVLKLYDQRCAFCKVRVMGNMFDGAHIQPFAEFRGDRFVNGLALCKNHQWAFYHSWFGIDDDY